MHSIYWKIFVSFWLAMVLIVSVAVFTSFRLADTQTGQLDEIDRIGTLRAAAAALGSGGVDGFRSWLSESANLPAGQTLYLIDGNGQDILGRQTPPAFRRGGPRGRRGPGRNLHSGVFPDFVGPDGSEYTPMFGPLPPRVLGMLGVPFVGLLVLSIGIVISAVVCYLLTRYLTRPLREIVAAAAALSRGRLETRVSTGRYRNDEIGELGRQFDAMASELQRQVNSRQELFRNISHELRSPLARIQVALALAQRKPGEVDRQLTRIGREADEMERLTQQVLGLVRVQEFDITRPELVDLVEVVDHVARDAGFEGQRDNKTIAWSAPPHPVYINGHGDLLRSAIENVVRNAIRFSPIDSGIDLELTTTGQEAILTVRDHGTGVALDELEQIFEPFFRGGQRHNVDGAGVGLAITRQVVTMLRGSVTAANATNGGLRVTVSLPLAAADSVSL